MPDIFEKEFDPDAFKINDNSIRKGDDVNLTQKDPSLRRVTIGLGWELKAFDVDVIDLDASCFLLDKNDKTRVDADFVFYNNPEGCDGAVKHNGDSRTGAGDGDDETMTIDLHGVPFDIVKIAFAVTIYGAHEKEQKLGMVSNAYLRILNADNGEEMLRYDITSDLQDRSEQGVIVATLDREGPKWHVRPVCEFVAGGLSELATRYGIVVAEKAS